MKMQKVKLFLTPHHDNLGDNAQANCIRKMLVDVFGIENVSSFNMKETSEGLDQVSKDDIIFMSSGGNLGDLWLNGELKRREIIQSCPNNMIISFPQTIAFNSKEQALISTKIYSVHSNLHIFARDVKSYSIAKELFPMNLVEQLPDPVFTASHIRNFERDGVLCIFRNDKEDFLKDIKGHIVKYCEKLNLNADVVDIEGREENFTAFLDMISKYKLVITDRFHGAVFASITGTPCLALPTINHKIIESDFWFKKLNTKTFVCKDFDEFDMMMLPIPNSYEYNSSLAKSLYYRVLFSIAKNRKIAISNPVQDCIVNRRTVRKWSPETVSKEVLYDIIRAGIHAPTGSNAQCVRFKLIQDKQKILSICEAYMGRGFKDPPSSIIMTGYYFGKEKTVNFGHINSIWEPLKYQDVAAAIQNMQLYCESIGLSYCWLSFFIDRRQKFLDSIDIEDCDVEYLSGLAIGFSKSKVVHEINHQGFPVKRKNMDYYIL